LPSFTSFSSHKSFFKKNHNKIHKNKDYIEYIISNTEWYEIPLKVLRDKYLMHSAEKHMSHLGYSSMVCWDLHLTTIIPASPRQQKVLEKVKVIRFSPRRLARDIENFLIFFANQFEINKKAT
jgi:hypothetical protein